MKLTNKLVEKVGADKLLHFLVTAWIMAEAKCFGLVPMLVVFVLLIVLGIFKEIELDTQADYADVKWSAYGGFTTAILYIVSEIIVKPY